MSPKEVIDIHREMTQVYHEPRYCANVAFAMLISLFLIVAAFVLASISAGGPGPVGTGGPPLYDDSFAARQRNGS